MGKVVAIENSKGGVGKTTIVSNLAVGLQIQGHSVLGVDRDFLQRTYSDWREKCDHDKYPMVVCVDKPTIHIDIQKIAGSFDYVIIDGASKAELMAASSIKAADIVLIPVTPSGADVSGASSVVEMIKQRQILTDGYPLAAFIINADKKGTCLSKEVENALIEKYALPVFKSRISESVIYPECLQTSTSVFDENLGLRVVEKAEEFNLLIEELKGFINEKETKRTF